MAGMLKVTQIRSAIGRTERTRRTLRGLGLTRMHKSMLLKDTDAVRGMIRAVQHMVKVEKAD